MSAQTVHRMPAGIPAGGQYTETHRDAATLTLVPPHDPAEEQPTGALLHRAQRASALEEGRRTIDALDLIEQNLQAGAYGENTALLKHLIDRETAPLFNDDFESPEVPPGAFAAVGADFLSRVSDAREQLCEEICDYARDSAPYAPKGMGEASEWQVRAHLRNLAEEARTPHMTRIIWEAVASDAEARLGVLGLEAADLREIEDVYVDESIDDLQAELVRAWEAM